ncbi:MAG TPA: alpha-hydroxy-acid oxidizing protein, partial [Terricaulis sp.]|nr:alpha-hydroxy-acid oxidizing protein [Terricaulis sp.]
DGIMVSNHGGRQVDGGIGALDALAAIAPVIGGKIPLFMDSGIRCGADIFKALALGAQAVGIGRPYAYGLALGGDKGVQAVMEYLLAELDLTMALNGCRTPADIKRDLLGVNHV